MSLIKLQELSNVWKLSALMDSPENLYMILHGQLWLPRSHIPARRGGDFSPWERDQIQSVLKKWSVSKFKSCIADAVSLPAVHTICSFSSWVLVFCSAYHLLLLQITFDGHIYVAAYALAE